MTREEAREELKAELEEFISGSGLTGHVKEEADKNPDFKYVYEANMMAIKALEQEPCEDAINRILKRMWYCRGKHTTSIDKVRMEQIIRDELSSVNPKADVLDKIRAEVVRLKDYDKQYSYKRILEIIDKYKASPTGKEVKE